MSPDDRSSLLIIDFTVVRSGDLTGLGGGFPRGHNVISDPILHIQGPRRHAIATACPVCYFQQELIWPALQACPASPMIIILPLTDDFNTVSINNIAICS